MPTLHRSKARKAYVHVVGGIVKPWCLPASSLHASTCIGLLLRIAYLELLLKVEDGKRYRNPEKWKTSAANFLNNCPQLRKLILGFSNDWDETATVFSNIAQKAIFSHLQHFKLDFLRCQGEDLLLFLRNHEDLHSLSLKNLDITGRVLYRDILGHLQHHHSRLETFKSSQMAQNSFRTFFEKHGQVECQRSATDNLLLDEPWDFFDDFVGVVGPFIYSGVAEAWEGVQDKIGVLKNDLRISEQTNHSDLARHGTDDYRWLD